MAPKEPTARLAVPKGSIQLELARGSTVVDDRLEEQVQDAEALGDEQQVPDWVKECEGALDLGCGHDLALDGGELITQLSHTLLEFGWPARRARPGASWS
jgi:hypothetical protein